MRILTTVGLLLCVSAANAQPSAYDSWFDKIGNGLISRGAPEEQVVRVMKRITNLDMMNSEPGSWVYEFAVPGRTYLARAESAEVDGDLDEALKNYRIAYGYFSASRFPALYTPERAASYRKQLDCFFKIAQIRNFDIEIVEIPYEGKTIIGNLYKRNGDPAPVLIWSGGLDGWKDGSLDFKQRLMDAGFSVFCVDLPGTGQSQWILEATSERIYSRIADYLKTREDVDGTRLAAYFGSFSGVYAIKLALKDPDFMASVNHSGGVHAFFTPPIRELPPVTISMGMRASATIHAMGLKGLTFNGMFPVVPDIDVVLSTFSGFSLKYQGYLQPHANQAPLLTIHGTEDDLMPVSDVYLLTDSGIKQDTLIYEGDGHMAWEHEDDHQSKMIAWLQEKLQVK